MCPMDRKCNNQNMIYQAEVTTTTARETYIGLCDATFKLRYRNHVCFFKNERYKHATELSKYIWSLKDKSIPYNIKWRKVKQARSYSNISKRCNLCLWEKYFIIYKPDMSTLNNRSELISNCRHSKKFLLKNRGVARGGFQGFWNPPFGLWKWLLSQENKRMGTPL